jgi:hypothetical protein
MNTETLQQTFESTDSNVFRSFFLFIALIILGIVAYFVYTDISKKQNQSDQVMTQYQEKNNNLNSITATAANKPLSNYFVLSAFNCCNTGNIDDGFCSTAVLQSILKAGPRFLDFQIFSENNQPAVSSSTQANYNIKESVNTCPFVNVMNILATFAFSPKSVPNSTDPLILYFRFFSSNKKMYDNLAALLESYHTLLLDPSFGFHHAASSKTNLLCTTPLVNLMGKIIIMVDGTNNSFMDSPKFCEFVNITSNSMNLRCLQYNQVLNSPDLHELQHYNCLNNMTIVLPDIVGGVPENPNGNVCREAYVNFVTVMFNIRDATFEDNLQFFNKNGTAFVMKPACAGVDPSGNTVPDPIPQKSSISSAPRDVQASNGVTFQV